MAMSSSTTEGVDGRPLASVRLESVVRRFGDVLAVDRVDLSVEDGEFFSLLGPSGSGKTTTLRMIAGFERPDEGRVLLHGDDVTTRAPYERDVNTVFQDYALFPHMSVGENVGYSLVVRGVAPAERRERVADALHMVALDGLEGRRVNELSGGQRQRVALARALINRPSVLLLDEPLGALDLKLRQRMQYELKSIQQQVGITFVYVTHDQEEALTMSDRLAVFNGGRIEQVGSPAEVYEHPSTAFVADFVGTSNVLAEDVVRLAGGSGPVSVRPERIRLVAPTDEVRGDLMRLDGVVREAIYLGMHSRFIVETDAGVELLVHRQNLDDQVADVQSMRGRRVVAVWDRAFARPLG